MPYSDGSTQIHQRKVQQAVIELSTGNWGIVRPGNGEVLYISSNPSNISIYISLHVILDIRIPWYILKNRRQNPYPYSEFLL